MAIDICGASTGGTSVAGTRERRVCVAYTVNATLLAALLVAVLVSGCGPGVQEIVEVFDKFDCEFIALFQPDSINPNKTLKVEFKGFKIGGNRYYAESLYYSRDGAVEMAESVLTDWYYSALLYQ
jgi:hypothetical protein